VAESHPSDLLSAPATAAERSEKITMSDLLALWIGERKPPPRSQVAYRGKVNRLVNFLGHDDAGKISDRDMIHYKEHLLKNPALSQKNRCGASRRSANNFPFWRKEQKNPLRPVG
jgi:hypothetical protein